MPSLIQTSDALGRAVGKLNTRVSNVSAPVAKASEVMSPKPQAHQLDANLSTPQAREDYQTDLFEVDT